MPVLTDIAQSAVKEKVIRIVLATFRVSLTVDATSCLSIRTLKTKNRISFL